MEKFKLISKNKIDALPKTAGVYAFKAGRILLYIGKAVNVRQRVKNHFQAPGLKGQQFVKQATKIGYIKTNSEIGALLLEAALIKKLQPKYNVIWRDDKNYFYVAVTKEEFPRAFLTHQLSEARPQIIIGPFVDGKALKKTLRILRKVFPYRTCRTLPKRQCLYYDLALCPAPCLIKVKSPRRTTSCLRGRQKPKVKSARQKLKVKEIKKENQKNIRNLTNLLRGKKGQVLRNLKKEMQQASKNRQFELAAKLRDQIYALENVFANAHILQELPKKEPMNWQETEKTLRKILYPKNKTPKEDKTPKTKTGTISCDRRKLSQKIKKVEAYDISNIQGTGATGSMVVFENGEPNKQAYRKFKIKMAEKPNDVAMLKEMLSRRLQHPEWPLPQVMLIDGGIAQLNVAKATKCQMSKSKCQIKSKIQMSKINKIKILAIAKRKNELFIEGRKKPVLLKNLPQEISNLILHLRDEAHRFAISYHKKIRSKDFLPK